MASIQGCSSNALSLSLSLQNWTYPGTPPTLLPRDTPITVINRVPSVFAKHATPTKSPKSVAGGKAVEHKTGPLDVAYVGLSLKNIVTSGINSESPCIFYEQYCIDEDYFRLGKGLSGLCAQCRYVSCDVVFF